MHWQCEGTTKYSLEPIDKKDRGTEVILHLNDDEKEFLELDILLTLSKEKNKQKLILSILREAIEKKREDIDTIKELMEKNNVG